MRPYRKQAFTLIELLIVVAIIAILAAIAVPNFLEAQVRSKVSRGKNDMRAIANALEAYRIDSNRYPMDSTFYNPLFGTRWPGGGKRYRVEQLNLLTTPVSYITSLPKNVFPDKERKGLPEWDQYVYYGQFWKEITGTAYPETGKMWALVSVGPDLRDNNGVYLMYGEEALNKIVVKIPGRPDNYGAVYDPTNGTVSNGDIVRVGP